MFMDDNVQQTKNYSIPYDMLLVVVFGKSGINPNVHQQNLCIGRNCLDIDLWFSKHNN